MALHVDIDRALVLLAAVPYEETIVGWIRTLPERRYRTASRDWAVPARREHLRLIWGLIGELEERDVDVKITSTARARLARVDVGRAVLRKDAIEIAGPFSQRRLPSLRALPERRFDADRKTWMIPLTRAGALALLTLAGGHDELVITGRARHAVMQSAAPSPGGRRKARSVAAPAAPARRSPVAHWRHYTKGPIFDNPQRQRNNVPGVGWCVRIRVNPRRSQRRHAAQHHTPDLHVDL